MIICMDMDYREDRAVAAGALFTDWESDHATLEIVETVKEMEPYVPGGAYRRELPGLMAVLRQVNSPLEAIIVDGYVWLDETNRAGLGGHLYKEIEGKVPVIGVAKSCFRPAIRIAKEVLRGASARPLYVTSAGIDVEQAAANIRHMHGEHRLPTMLKLADRLCRGREF